MTNQLRLRGLGVKKKQEAEDANENEVVAAISFILLQHHLNFALNSIVCMDWWVYFYVSIYGMGWDGIGRAMCSVYIVE